MIKWMTATRVTRVVFEPTGFYHRAFERRSPPHAFRSSRSTRVRRVAEATGKLAKTDRLDAAMLARKGALLGLEARPARSDALAELKELHVAREPR